MFSSNNNNNNNNNSYPLYYNNQSPSIYTNRAIPENNNIFLQHYYGKFLPPTSYPPISDNSIVNFSSEPSINQQNGLLCPSNVRVSSSRRAAGKKDRHTKITTAQGVRDRRVRLSMSIAREFFNLQDMLGFDKASKTLGWLLNKSKAAIDELASTSNFKSPVTPSDNEVDVTSEEDQQQQKEFCTSKNNEESSSKKRKRREKNNNTRNVVNELRRREEARERARERTRKKKIVNDHHQKHLESSSNLMICQLNPEISNGGISKEGGGSSTVRESVVIKGNYSNKSNNYNYEMISSKDEQDNCNYYNDYFNKSASESCNYYSGILQPNGFPALNIINLSTEIHINARPWDTYGNHILH